MVATISMPAVSVYVDWNAGSALSHDGVAGFGMSAVLGISSVSVMWVVSILLWADIGGDRSTSSQ